MTFNSCPICGHSPMIKTQSLDRGNGHGYPGHFMYHIACSNNRCPLCREVPIFSMDDISRDRDQVYSDLCEIWNEETVHINELILHRQNLNSGWSSIERK